MKPKIYLLIIFGFLFTVSSHAQILRSFTARYNNPSVKGNIVYVSNSIISTNGVTGTGEAPPSGTSTNNSSYGINIDVDNSTTTILPYASSWKYWDQGSRPVSWETTGFADGAWPSGNAELGYGDGDEATIVGYGGNASNKYTTTYFRKVINIPNPALYASFIFNLVRDDGAVIYVNGVEVTRDNMPTGVITNTTFSSSVVSGTGETTAVPYNIPSSAFVSGNNTIAVEIHQSDLTSSDISFKLEILGVSDNGTFNSSTSNLNLASCSQVLFAGLYWGAGQGTDGTNTSWITGHTTCKIKVPGASTFTNVTSTQTDLFNASLIAGYAHTGYMCFADITPLINTTNANGTYSLANVVAPTGINDSYGGWTIVVVYSNPSLPTRNLTVFDGCAGVKTGSGNVDVNISGFLTPPTGTVSCELGTVAYDGDRGSADAYSFKQNGAASFYDLTPTATNPTSNLNDMWNSTISYKGAVVTSRNPAFQNTLGYDADIIDLPNAANAQLSNSQTSATVRFSSPSENYLVHVVTTSISQYSPAFAMDKTSVDVNGGSLVPGDILRYQINYSNVGNDASTSSVILDNIPAGTTFVPGTIKIDGVAKTDAAGDDQAEYDLTGNMISFRVGTGSTTISGGSVNSGAAGSVQFDVVVGSSCAFFSCGHTASNSARFNYIGQTSGQSLYDSSGITIAGCFTRGPVTNTVTGLCYTPSDTSLVNSCPSTSVLLPWMKYAGYSFYSAMPFNSTTIFSPYTAVTATHTYFAYYSSGTGCSDTIKINVYIVNCPDIDDDNDGIPDYVEINLPASLLDSDGDGIPNWKDTDYPGYTDNNGDGFNDNFDPSADSDNDGVPNFMDKDFPGYIDSNGDGVNDNMDKDLDGIPNNFDLDSDNDGIPDVVESGGVDADGDGRIDNYTDTDNDGFSQNVDLNNTGIAGSGNGLGTPDTDGDGIPNYLDLDSDNDGIPDIIEVYGTDTNNDGRVDNYVDTDGDGFSDSVDGDVGNDNVAENSTAALLRTGADINNDGRADSYPYRNIDSDSRSNPYDLDSDGDGITDVREGFPALDANNDGFIDGTFNSNGWSITVSAMGTLTLPDNDGTGRTNPYDIDSDDDGITDNIEGQATAAYQLPSGSDTDGDGIDNSYDNFAGFGGNGINPVNTDGDALPDYRDTDTDGDGTPDIYEGNDYNGNGFIDDGVVPSGNDSDGDGLDDYFDLSASPKVTSAKMGNGGSLTGDPSAGTKASLQINALYGCATQRDWRCVAFVLNCTAISFHGELQGTSVKLRWATLCQQDIEHFVVEKSTDGISFNYMNMVTAKHAGAVAIDYHDTDDVSAVKSGIIYYRLKSVSLQSKISYSNTVKISIANNGGAVVQIIPNPVKDDLKINIVSTNKQTAAIRVFDINGRLVIQASEIVREGNNYFQYNQAEQLPDGLYYLLVKLGEKTITAKFNKINSR